MVGKWDKNHEIRCCMCGHWINNIQYGSMFNGQFIDYTTKKCGEIVLTFCNECTLKMMEYCGEDDE